MNFFTHCPSRCAGSPSRRAAQWSRRDFLATAACAGASVAFTPDVACAAGSVAGSWRMRLSTSSIHFKDLSIELACERIAALGYEAIDIWSAYEKCPHLDDVAQRLGPTGLKALLAKHQLKLCAFSAYVGGYARYAELLGQSGDGVAIQGSAGPCEAKELTSRMKSFFESLKPLVDLAGKYNSHLAIENHGHALLESLDSLKAFVDLNPSPRLGIALAPYHLQAINASVEEAIAICGRQLLFFYAWQNQPGPAQLPGVGPTDFKPWLNALAKANYRGYVNPFMHGHVEAAAMASALAKSKNYLIRLNPDRSRP